MQDGNQQWTGPKAKNKMQLYFREETQLATPLAEQGGTADLVHRQHLRKDRKAGNSIGRGALNKDSFCICRVSKECHMSATVFAFFPKGQGVLSSGVPQLASLIDLLFLFQRYSALPL